MIYTSFMGLARQKILLAEQGFTLTGAKSDAIAIRSGLQMPARTPCQDDEFIVHAKVHQGPVVESHVRPGWIPFPIKASAPVWKQTRFKMDALEGASEALLKAADDSEVRQSSEKIYQSLLEDESPASLNQFIKLITDRSENINDEYGIYSESTERLVAVMRRLALEHPEKFRSEHEEFLVNHCFGYLEFIQPLALLGYGAEPILPQHHLTADDFEAYRQAARHCLLSRRADAIVLYDQLKDKVEDAYGLDSLYWAQLQYSYYVTYNLMAENETDTEVAEIYDLQGFEAARQAAEIARSLVGPDFLLSISFAYALACSHFAAQDFEKAQNWFYFLLSGRPDSREALDAEIRLNMASMAFDQMDAGSERALELHGSIEIALREDDKTTVENLRREAKSLEASLQWHAKGVVHAEKAVAILEELDSSPGDLRQARAQLGCFYMVIGRNQEAIEVLEQVWDSLFEEGGPDEILATAHNLASAYYGVGDSAGVLPVLRQLTLYLEAVLEDIQGMVDRYHGELESARQGLQDSLKEKLSQVKKEKELLTLELIQALGMQVDIAQESGRLEKALDLTKDIEQRVSELTEEYYYDAKVSAYVTYAEIYALMGNREQAVLYAEKVRDSLLRGRIQQDYVIDFAEQVYDLVIECYCERASKLLDEGQIAEAWQLIEASRLLVRSGKHLNPGIPEKLAEVESKAMAHLFSSGFEN